MPRIEHVGEQDLDDLLPLMRAYCGFYGAAPRDAGLLAMSRALIADPERGGTTADRTGGGRERHRFRDDLLELVDAQRRAGRRDDDLYLAPEARGQGLADALIAACVECCRGRGDVALSAGRRRRTTRARRPSTSA